MGVGVAIPPTRTQKEEEVGRRHARTQDEGGVAKPHLGSRPERSEGRPGRSHKGHKDPQPSSLKAVGYND